ncbi:MAG: hypothetical protein P1V20_06750 [Verrucomicrobiales bacterium]|nr:hypothetical protein [Verrucomicrobiales bacterium]
MQKYTCLTISLSIAFTAFGRLAYSETFTWKNTKAPDAPVMTDPIIISSLAQLEKHIQTSPTNPNPVPSGESPLYPAGPVYYPGPATGVAATSDVIIDLRSEAGAVTLPLRIWQARNVRLIGLKMKLKAPAEGEKGKLKNSDGAGFIQFANPYPRVPAGAALGIAHSHVLYIEGCDIDCNGNNIDAIVPSPNHGQTTDDQLANRKIVLINSRVTGFRGHNVVEGIGEGLHCDAMQLQSGTVGEIFIENVDIKSGHEGFVLNPVTDPASPAYAPAPRQLTINRVSYDIDTGWVDEDPRMHQYPVALATNVPVKSMKITRFEYRRLQGGDSKTGKPYSGPHGILHVSPYKATTPHYIFTYHVDPEQAAPNLHPMPGLQRIEGTIAAGDLPANPMTVFAPAEHLGNGYKPGKDLY